MSKMGDLFIEVEELNAKGFDAGAISNFTGMPLHWILDVLKNLEYNDEEFSEIEDCDSKT
jgi:hypothetical protein